MGLKQNIHRPYASLDLIEVEAPEFPDKDGKPSLLKFRRRLTVDDVASLADMKLGSTFATHLALFRLLAVNDDGTPLVDPNDDEWFRKTVDGMHVVDVSERAGLLQSVAMQTASEDGAEGDAGN